MMQPSGYQGQLAAGMASMDAQGSGRGGGRVAKTSMFGPARERAGAVPARTGLNRSWLLWHAGCKAGAGSQFCSNGMGTR